MADQNQPPPRMKLSEALGILADVHTRDDGGLLLIDACPNVPSWFQWDGRRSLYTDAWLVVAQAVKDSRAP